MKDRKFEVIDRATGPGETISEWMDDEGHDGRPGRQDRGHQGHRPSRGVTKEPSRSAIEKGHHRSAESTYRQLAIPAAIVEDDAELRRLMAALLEDGQRDMKARRQRLQPWWGHLGRGKGLGPIAVLRPFAV
jgi:hypothetical protein